MTTTDERSFLARIAANPADDTDRLVYADWLDENPSPDAKCGHCLGEPCRAFFHGPTSVFWKRVGVRADMTVYECLACAATGSVPDTSRRERAEFIRVQCELARNPRTALTCQHCGCDDGYNHNTGCLYSREAALLTAHETEWRRAGVCPECWGSGTQVSGQPGPACPRCWGSGDVGGLLRTVSAEWNGGGRFGTAVPLRVDFERGFPAAVHCAMSDVVDAAGVPTSWARAVAKCHPVTRFVVGDKRTEPYRSMEGGPIHYGWCRGVRPREPFNLPCEVWDELRGYELYGPWADYPTAEAANDALHTALARLAAGS